MLTTTKAKTAHEAARKAVEKTMIKVGIGEPTLREQLQNHIDAMGQIESVEELSGYARCLRTIAEAPLVTPPTRMVITKIADTYLATYSDELGTKVARGGR